MTAVSVFGLGYVGCVSAACLAHEGHTVVGVDVSSTKVDLINLGRSTVVEAGIGELVAEGRAAGRLSATGDLADAVHSTSVSLICVGTPSRPNGSLELGYVTRVCREIGSALRTKPGGALHTIVIRSTVLPGTIHGVVVPAVEEGFGRPLGDRIAVCSNPEFLREGTSVKDFYDPPFTLIGADNPTAAAQVRTLYAGLTSPVHDVPVRVAEMIKYACNCFHALKVGFANEIGNICRELGADSHDVMRIFCEDRKLNISTAYLRPGFAFGGSCLPKDLRALTYRAREVDVVTPILSAILESNQRQIERGYEMVAGLGRRRVGILGMAFKAGTDDLRESPIVTLIERLVGKGYEVAIYDREVSEARLVGANREFIEKEIPHIWTLMRPSVAEVLAYAETIVVGNGSAEFREIGQRLTPGQQVVDLVRLFDAPVYGNGQFHGISW